MSFRLKKQKQIKQPTGNISIEFLHEEKLKYFEMNKDKDNIQEEMNNYFLDTCDILSKYYEIKSKVKTINPYDDTIKKNQNTELEQEYYQICNIAHKFTMDKIENVCCNEEMNLNPDSFYACYTCGKVGGVHINGSSFKQIQETSITNKFVYKRINYFKDWIKQIQGSEMIEIPNELIDKIKLELTKTNISDLSKLKPYLVKKILKELKESKYYENINSIMSKLTNKPAITISNSMCIQMENMFYAIQEPYEKIKGERTSSLSYSFIIYKLCELLDLRDVMGCVQLSKSRDKILQYDIIWKKIIIEMKNKDDGELWKFIPSC
jgi:hypothetical protein